MKFKNIIFRDIYPIEPIGFGLDISDLSMKAALLGFKAGKTVLKDFGEHDIELGLVENREIKNESKMAKIISEALGEFKLKSKYVVSSLPEQRAFIRVVQFPKLSKEDLLKAMFRAAEENIPMSINEVYLDYQIIPDGDLDQPLPKIDHLDVLIVASPKKLVDSYINVLKEAGLKPLALEVESQAIARALLKNSYTEVPVLLVDIGATRSSLIVFSSYAPRFTTTIPISGKDFENAISEKLRVDIKEARNLKISVGLDQTKIKGRVAAALMPVMDSLLKEIKKYISFYHEHTEHEHGKIKKISKILLCGGDANLIGLTAYLSLALKMPVELADPWINILTPPYEEIPELPKNKALAYTTALGLALRGINKI